MRGQFLSPCSSYGYCNSFYGSDVIPIDDEFFLLHEVDDGRYTELLALHVHFNQIFIKLADYQDGHKIWPDPTIHFGWAW